MKYFHVLLRQLSSFYVLDSFDYFGYSCGSVSDVDGDGVDDMVVGATGDDDGDTGAGAVYILMLTTDGLVPFTSCFLPRPVS